MARIPLNNRYPNTAGYAVLNTDTNQLEVFSDGTFKPIEGGSGGISYIQSNTLANWQASNPVLDLGEAGYIIDTNEFVIGDGQTTFNNLKRFLNESQIATTSRNGFMSSNDKSNLETTSTNLNNHIGSTDGHPTATTTSNGFMTALDKQKLDNMVAPSYIENAINVYVGPGGDYATVNEAFAYINSIKPKLSTNNWTDNEPPVNLIFKTGYEFTEKIPIINQYMPWLHITQENINTPLNVNFTEYSGAINLFKSVIGEINLNLYNPNSYTTAFALQIMDNSYIDKVSLTAENMRVGISMRNSEIRNINRLVLNKMGDYGLVMAYNSYALVTANTILSINDVGKTNAGYGIAIHVNESNLRLYRATNYSITNAKRALNIMEQGQIIISEGTLNIDNCDYGIYFSFNGGKIVYTTADISFGTGVTTNWYPTSIVKNTWNHRGIIID